MFYTLIKTIYFYKTPMVHRRRLERKKQIIYVWIMNV